MLQKLCFSCKKYSKNKSGTMYDLYATNIRTFSTQISSQFQQLSMNYVVCVCFAHVNF